MVTTIWFVYLSTMICCGTQRKPAIYSGIGYNSTPHTQQHAVGLHRKISNSITGIEFPLSSTGQTSLRGVDILSWFQQDHHRWAWPPTFPWQMAIEICVKSRFRLQSIWPFWCEKQIGSWMPAIHYIMMCILDSHYVTSQTREKKNDWESSFSTSSTHYNSLRFFLHISMPI